MKRVKIVVAATAALIGIAGALAANVQSNSKAAVYDWIDWDGNLILAGATQSHAQGFCASSSEICLRARNEITVYTTGYLPWTLTNGKNTKAAKPATGSQDSGSARGSK